MIKPMNVLLTGGMGYIGSHTSTVLTNLGHRVVLYDNLSNSNDLVLEKLLQITQQKIPFINGDVRDTELLIKTLLVHHIDAVIHFAGLKAVGESMEKPVDYYANNIQGSISLLQAMQSVQVKTLVFSSSATVYGKPQYLPLDEHHPTNATNPYGRNKLFIEEMLNDVVTSDPGWRIACLRYFNPVGAHESGLIGENPKGVPNNLMPYMAQVATGQQTELKIFGNDYPTADGTGIRDYIHVMDLAEGHAAALAYLYDHLGLHTINLGTGRGYSVLQMVRAFEAASRRVIPLRIVSRREGDVAEYYANPARAEQKLNWKASRSLENMCDSAWNFQKITKKA
jgi:UDP-glucose 4-epimerase